MHIGDSPDEAAFRAEARAWLGQHASRLGEADHSDTGMGHGDLGAHVQRCRDWQKVLYEQGWAGITWPTAFGGRGASAIQSAIFAEEQSQFDVAVGSFAVAIGMVGPTLMAHGTPAQHEAHLGPILRGDQLWCQLFSEPGAGSDLAGLATRAELDGDHWVVNGQKVWTSLGQFADYGILLARTDPDAPKHGGITYFIVDMRSPGIEVRPLVQMTGVAHFNEVFLTDVRIPVENVVGEVNGGWSVAHTTLSNERSAISGGSSWTVEQLIDLAQRHGRANDPVVRQGLAQAECRAATLRYLGLRLRTAMSQRRMPGPEMLIMKLAFARHWAQSADLAVSIVGAGATLWGDDAPESNAWGHNLLSQFAVRLGGGTDEIQANIIAERGLGLPREPDPTKGTSWRETARS